jgi:hypothetical protein
MERPVIGSQLSGQSCGWKISALAQSFMQARSISGMYYERELHDSQLTRICFSAFIQDGNRAEDEFQASAIPRHRTGVE